MKTALITMCIDRPNSHFYKDLLSLSKPYMIDYANKINSDFIIIDQLKIKYNNDFYFEKCQLKDYLNEYDRIIYIDTDTIIKYNTPNLFDIVPINKLGVCFIEYTNVSENALFDLLLFNQITNTSYTTNQFNSGLMVFSYYHKKLFDINLHNFIIKKLHDEFLFNINAHLLNYDFFKLDYKFNVNMYNKKKVLKKDIYIKHFLTYNNKYNLMKQYIKELQSEVN